MKKSVVSIIVLMLMSSFLYSMEEKLTKKCVVTEEQAEKLFWKVAPGYDQGAISFEIYKEILYLVIPALGYTQHHCHNSLNAATYEGDLKFAKFLLEYGASPTFRGINCMNAFDILQVVRSKPFSNSGLKDEFKNLFSRHLDGQEISAYPLAHRNELYLGEEEQREWFDIMLKKFADMTLSRGQNN